MRARRRSAGKAASMLSLGTELAMLGVEAQMVIGQRMAMFMLGGPKARKEARLMVTEEGQGRRRSRGDDRLGRDAAQGRARLPAEGSGQSPATEQGLSAASTVQDAASPLPGRGLAQHARELLDRVRLVQQLEAVGAVLRQHVAVAGGQHHRQVVVAGARISWPARCRSCPASPRRRTPRRSGRRPWPARPAPALGVGRPDGRVAEFGQRLGRERRRHRRCPRPPARTCRGRRPAAPRLRPAARGSLPRRPAAGTA